MVRIYLSHSGPLWLRTMLDENYGQIASRGSKPAFWLFQGCTSGAHNRISMPDTVVEINQFKSVCYVGAQTPPINCSQSYFHFQLMPSKFLLDEICTTKSVTLYHVEARLCQTLVSVALFVWLIDSLQHHKWGSALTVYTTRHRRFVLVFGVAYNWQYVTASLKAALSRILDGILELLNKDTIVGDHTMDAIAMICRDCSIIENAGHNMTSDR